MHCGLCCGDFGWDEPQAGHCFAGNQLAPGGLYGWVRHGISRRPMSYIPPQKPGKSEPVNGLTGLRPK